MLFILWLMLPQTQGATYFYYTFVDPTLTRHEEDIDSTLGRAQQKAINKGAEWGKYGFVALKNVAADGLVKGLQVVIPNYNYQQEDGKISVEKILPHVLSYLYVNTSDVNASENVKEE
ncbi:14236_t:CDS:2 [Funneliformis caledonium]|uniref:14236_t:CDS:1 n=2 Tax=Funneliformis TaxID=1117308 RepID=A0A9N9G475_9GLOM|nr:14236_t:CDS:2 [Funneliformis caledonium]CAG8612140.1 6153_t:CDS:2 [Funneliformis mosseae]